MSSESESPQFPGAAPDQDPFGPAPSPADARAQLQLAMDLAGILVWRRDIVRDRVYYDERSLRLAGIEPQPDGVPSQAIRDLVHPEDLPALLASIERALASNGPVDVQVRYRRADGTWRHVLTRRVVQRDPEGRPLHEVGVVLDVTEPLMHQQRELELSRKLSMAAAAAGVAIWSYRFGAAQADWNEQMYQLHGVAPGTPAPPLDEYLERFALPQDAAMVRARLRAPRSESALQPEVEIRIRRTDGTQRLVHVRGRIERFGAEVYALGAMTDITQQRAAEQALSLANQRTALATRGAGIGTWEIDQVTNVAVWDEQMWRLRGRAPRPGPVHAADRLELVHPEDRAHVQRLMDVRSQLTDQVEQFEYRVCWPDGQVRWLAGRSVAVFDAQGKPVRRMGVNWDVTDARLAAQARQEALLAQRESQAKSEFLARMSHELRTPLNAILGFSELMLDESAAPPDPRQQREHLQRIHAAGRELLALVDGLLQHSTLDAAAARKPDPEPAAPQAPQLQSRMRRLLYIEDNEVNAMLVQELAQRRGDVQVEIAVDGTSGVARATEWLPDLVLVDMQLPDFDGLEVLRRLRGQSATAGLLCVALSANVVQRDIDNALAAGFAEYWTKPLDFAVFMSALDAIFKSIRPRRPALR